MDYSETKTKKYKDPNYDGFYWNKSFNTLFDNTHYYKFKNYYRYNINNILNDISINYFSSQKNTDTQILYGYVENCESYLEIFKKTNNYEPVTKFHCEITKDNVHKLKPYHNKNQKHIINYVKKMGKYLNDIGGKLFFKYIKINTSKYYITVYYSDYPPLKNHVKTIKKYIKSRSTTRLYNLIQNYTFCLYIKDDHIKTILDLSINDVANIKNSINNFFIEILGQDYDELLTSCTVRQYENIYVYVMFSLNNIKNEWKYASYYNMYYVGIDIDDLYTKLKNNEKISYFETFYLKKSTYNPDINYANKFCVNDPVYSAYVEVNNNMFPKKRDTSLKNINNINIYYPLCHTSNDTNYITIQFNTLPNRIYDEQNELTKLEPIYYYYKNVDNRPYYYSHNILMKNKDNNEFYNVTIENLTFVITKLSQPFRTIIYHKMNNIKRTKKFTRDNKDIYFTKLPAFFGIKIQKVNKIDTIHNKLYIVESYNMYQKYVLTNLKKNMLDRMLILFSIIINKIVNNISDLNLHHNIKDIFIKKIIDNKYFSEDIKNKYYIGNKFLVFLMDRCIMKNKRFYITNKLGANDSFVLWHLPKFDIKCAENDFGKYIELLETLLKISENNNTYKQYYEEVNNNILIMNFILKYTNYTKIYNNTEFIHNIRHLELDKRVYINELLFSFMKTKYKTKMQNDGFINVYRNKYYVFCHYPNMAIYNLFHIQLVSTQDSIKVNKYDPDIFNKYIVHSNKRLLLWDKIKDVSFNKRDILIDFSLNFNIMMSNEYTKKFCLDEMIKNVTDIKY